MYRTGLDSHKIIKCLTFEEFKNSFFKVPMYEGLCFSTSLSTFSVVLLFDYGHPNGCVPFIFISIFHPHEKHLYSIPTWNRMQNKYNLIEEWIND
jgi:hypothetical protein